MKIKFYLCFDVHERESLMKSLHETPRGRSGIFPFVKSLNFLTEIFPFYLSSVVQHEEIHFSAKTWRKEKTKRNSFVIFSKKKIFVITTLCLVISDQALQGGGTRGFRLNPAGLKKLFKSE